MSPLLLRQSIGALRSKNFHLLVSYCGGGANVAVTPSADRRQARAKVQWRLPAEELSERALT
jgi:hypothetical protein